MNFIERYTKLSKKLIKADINKYKENFAIQITMDDEDCGGTFFVAFKDGVFAVEPYDYVDNTVNINIMALKLNKLIDKTISVDEAFDKDLIRANGNADHIVMLFDGFEKKATKTAKKEPAKKVEKKVAEKKEPAKKTVKKATEKKETKKAEPKAAKKK
ncbi:MAG: hypothetical protein UH854_01760 [Clostridia bacterium]|nr:hypothetical protein [Clostridia bacterium]